MTDYVIYQITNKVNGKVYVGAHKMKSKHDYYMGSGVLIRKAIKRYGIKNFERTILHTFDNAEDMYIKEAEIVNDEFLKRTDVYNLKTGGSDNIEMSAESVEKLRNALKGKPRSLEGRRKQSETRTGKSYPMSESTKSKIGDSLRNKPLSKTETCPLCGLMYHPSHIKRHIGGRLCKQTAGDK